MLSIKKIIIGSLGLIATSASMATTPVEDLLQEYRQQGATSINATNGRSFWNQGFRTSNQERRCASCHTSNPAQAGQHAVTGKEIKPLAPSVMTKRLTNTKKIRKWLRRNCNWTLGRECSAQEKADVLMYLKDL